MHNTYVYIYIIKTNGFQTASREPAPADGQTSPTSRYITISLYCYIFILPYHDFIILVSAFGFYNHDSVSFILVFSFETATQ